jgi:hypothetical protein
MLTNRRRLTPLPRCGQAECLTLPGHGEHVFRFCFQCGKLEPLSAFDGNKR